MLEVGTKAPDFALPDQNGEIHKLRITQQAARNRHVVFQIAILSLLKKVRLFLV